jgi:hypothetical protein
VPRSARGATCLQIEEASKPQLRDELLRLVNTDRSEARLSSLVLDTLACEVADRHAADMVGGNFLSHWGRDGLKPYQRYSLAGGWDAVAENNSGAHHLESSGPKYVSLTLAQMHTAMHDEVPPNDGHRRTILGPYHTHAGFGMALAERELRLVELYVSRYVQLAPYPAKASPGSTVYIEGKLLERKSSLHYAEICYEPPPQAPELAWLRVPRPYQLPAESTIVRPKLSDGTLYGDGRTGEIDILPGGGFRVPVRLNRKAPGVYTVVIWISQRGVKEPFQVTNACVQAE